ncbi:NAD-dependent deacylase [Ramlibacter sp. WS9]|uniref:SIR2 family NAD-dependent protein deacylase n=1 Tax=Ramlibacter sp. WS9 TaxID=1882741 RepID=UPI0011424F77|nr:NAD-dependent deacylase [Ramlibacter sp. WS9]ROZ78374.1 NAD-dependent deacylase [Ramlibacter sp. WS9]
MIDESSLRAVRGHLRATSRIVVLTGAGISAESGVPTFRDAQTGLWAKFDPQQLATEEAFRANPRMVWDWYVFRRELIGKVSPNAGHRALAEFASRHPGRLTLVTQNVDGLHQKAGSEGVLALHGNIFDDQWLDTPKPCCNADAAAAGSPPYCDRCGNLMRPGVVWFGEALPMRALDAAQVAARACDLMLVVGTSGAVYPAAGLARTTAGQVVIINPEPTELDDAADIVLRGKAAQVLPQLLLEE